MWTHSILLRSPLVAIFWTTYVPFIVVILSLIWRAGVRVLGNLWSRRSPGRAVVHRSKLAGAAASEQV